MRYFEMFDHMKVDNSVLVRSLSMGQIEIVLIVFLEVALSLCVTHFSMICPGYIAFTNMNLAQIHSVNEVVSK